MAVASVKNRIGLGRLHTVLGLLKEGPLKLLALRKSLAFLRLEPYGPIRCPYLYSEGHVLPSPRKLVFAA